MSSVFTVLAQSYCCVSCPIKLCSHQLWRRRKSSKTGRRGDNCDYRFGWDWPNISHNGRIAFPAEILQSMQKRLVESVKMCVCIFIFK